MVTSAFGGVMLILHARRSGFLALLQRMKHCISQQHFTFQHLFQLFLCNITGRSKTGFGPAKETTVDSTPTSQAPPSRIRGIFPFISANTSWAVVGLGLPDKLAEGAASGTPQPESPLVPPDGWACAQKPSQGRRTLHLPPVRFEAGSWSRGPAKSLCQTIRRLRDISHDHLQHTEIRNMRNQGIVLRGVPWPKKIFLTASPFRLLAASP